MQYQSPTSTQPQLTRSVTPSPKFQRIQLEKEDKIYDNRDEGDVARLIQECEFAKDLARSIAFNCKHFKNTKVLRAILMKIDSFKGEIDSRDAARLLGVVSNSKVPDRCADLFRAILTLLSDIALANLHQANAKDVSMTLHFLVKHGVRNNELLHHAAEYGVYIMDDFTPEGLSNMLLALAKTNSYSFEFFDRAAKAAVSMMYDEDFNSRSLCFMADAFARAKHYDAELFSAMSQKATPYLDNFLPQDLALLIDAFVRLEHDCDELVHATSNVIMTKVEYFSTEDLTSLASNLANYGYKHPYVLNVIAEKEIPFLHTLEAKCLSQLILAFVEMDHNHEDLFRASKVAAMHRMPSYEASEVVDIVTAFSKVKYCMDPLFTIAAEAAELALDDWHPKEIAKLLDVICRMKSFSESTDHLFGSIASLILSNPPEVTRWESRSLLDVALAFAKAGVMNTKLMEVIGKTILNRGDVFPAGAAKLQRLISVFVGYETPSAIRVMDFVFRQFMSLNENEIKFSLVMDIAIALPYGQRHDILPFGILKPVSELALAHGTKDEVFTVFEQFAKVGFDRTESSPKNSISGNGRKRGKKAH